AVIEQLRPGVPDPARESMAEALSPMQLESVIPGVGSGSILVDVSVGRIGFGWEAGGCGTLVVNSRRAGWVVGRVTIVWTAVHESQDSRWVSFLELNDVDCPSAHITGRYGLAAGQFPLNREVPLIVGGLGPVLGNVPRCSRAGHYGNDTIRIGRRSGGGPIGGRKRYLDFRPDGGIDGGLSRVGV